jgi:leucyl-tRNA synthetase
MSDYDPKAIEARWQARWDEAGLFRVDDCDPDRKQYYCLEMLPYPSGKLHMGHVRNYAIGDTLARFHRMLGEQVLHVIGWDSFGMPAENAAIQKGEAPRRWTLENIATMRSQLKRLGLGYDWNREIATCLPEFYRWNQWFFLRMLEKGIAYRTNRPLNWCDSCDTVLANEQVISGRCWRCNSPVARRQFEQWFLRTTDYAQELLDNLDRLESWPEKVRSMQQNWIGRSEGAEVFFQVEGSDLKILVFTTRIDTIYGATYLALAAEHPAIQELIRDVPENEAVQAFLDEQLAHNLEDRFADAVEKEGVFTGRYAVNPFSGERVPIWIANFVLTDVGTGAIMSVPAHDERDFAFARKYGLTIRPVVKEVGGAAADPETMEGAFSDYGIVCGSAGFDGLATEDAKQSMGRYAEEHHFGKRTVTYRLKDWGISRQRYWGTPIPVIHCAKCGPVGVPDDQLPVLLPDEVQFTGEGGSPLARVPSFVETTCPS